MLIGQPWELADLAQRFNRVEAYAHVKGRPDRRHAIAVVVGMSGRPEPLHDYFDVTDLERKGVSELVLRVVEALEQSGEERRNIILAALAELSARYLSPPVEIDMEPSVNGKREVS